MYRQIITPEQRKLTLQLPAEFVGHQVEVIAFTTDDIDKEQSVKGKRTYRGAIEFFRKNAVDLSKIKKWKREDLYE
jgi:hypothetical protein